MNERDRESQIREAAYEHWERAGCPAGRELDFWLTAETEISGREQGRPAADRIQEASEESFPASDPPAWIHASAGAQSSAGSENDGMTERASPDGAPRDSRAKSGSNRKTRGSTNPQSSGR